MLAILSIYNEFNPYIYHIEDNDDQLQGHTGGMGFFMVWD